MIPPDSKVEDKNFKDLYKQLRSTINEICKAKLELNDSF
jgi:hypothetical protein